MVKILSKIHVCLSKIVHMFSKTLNIFEQHQTTQAINVICFFKLHMELAYEA